MALNDSSFTLSNGLRCFTRHEPSVKAVSLLVDVYAGSSDDDIHYAGEHHAFEHLPFRGTHKFPDNFKLTNPLEKYSAALNANTGFRRTRYFVTLPSRAVEVGAEHLPDLVFNPLLRAEDWEKEMNVVLQEWESCRQRPGSVMSDEVFAKSFPGTPWSFTPIGHYEAIKRLNIDRLRKIHQRDYTVENCHVIAAGNLPPSLQDILEKWFGSLEIPHGIDCRGRMSEQPVELNPWSFSNALFKQPVISAFAYFPKGNTRREDAAQELANMMLSEGFSSPLFQELRVNKNLAYAFDLDCSALSPHLEVVGMSTNSSVCTGEQLLGILQDCVDKTVDNWDRFDFVKTAKLSDMDMHVFRAGWECNRIANNLLAMREVETHQDVVDRYESITFEEVRQAMLHFFDTSKFTHVTGRL